MQKFRVWLQDLLLQDMNVRIYGTVKKTHQFICTMYYVAPETPMMSSVIADCPDLTPPQYFGQVYAYDLVIDCYLAENKLILCK